MNEQKLYRVDAFYIRKDMPSPPRFELLRKRWTVKSEEGAFQRVKAFFEAHDCYRVTNVFVFCVTIYHEDGKCKHRLSFEALYRWDDEKKGV